MALTATGKRIGRPRKPIPEAIASQVIDLLAQGQSLKSIAKLRDMPSAERIITECSRDPIFAERYVRAFQARAWRYADELIAIADEPCADSTEVNRNRLRCDMRRWFLSKLLHHTFGDRVEVTSDHSVRITLATGVTPSVLEHTPRLIVETSQPAPPPALEDAPEDGGEGECAG